MEEMRRRKEDELNWLQKNWEIIAFIIVLVFGAGEVYTTLANHEPRITCLETKVEKIDVMANDINWIKQGIEELKKRR